MALFITCRRLCSSRAIFRPSAAWRRRFVPPWERDGKSADEFFAGLMKSGNPVQAERRRAAREAVESERQEEMRDAALSPAEQQRLDAMHAHNAEIAARRRDFLPYGAKPRVYFEHNQMAALGEYEAMLRASGSPYSAATRDLLRADVEQKLPYRYESFLERRGAPLWPLHGTAALVLDIDGVVYRSHRLVDGADTAIRTATALRIPLLFMTNGGGLSEAEKAQQLSQLVGCEIDASQVLLAHTPMQLLAPTYSDRQVLIVGPSHCAEVAREYGFRRAVSVLQFQAEHPEMVPLKRWGEMQTSPPGTVPFGEFAAVMQFTDSEDGFNDVQSILDVLLAPRGHIGTYVSGTQSLPYYAAADDLLWATEAPLPRLGQGAFREMLSATFESVTGHGLHVTMYGKPRSIAYAFAERRLEEVTARLGWDPRDLRAIFMVGDNIESDIVGANASGGRWTSVHVLSGVGSAPAARRTLADGDTEMEWIDSCVNKTPHYVSPTLDHFVRELLAFPEEAVLQNKRPYYGMPNPVNINEMYHFPSRQSSAP